MRAGPIRALLFALVALLFVTPSRAAPDRVDAIVRRQMALNAIPGAAVAVVEHGRIVKIATYGMANLEWAAPVGRDTRFQLASVTKMFTGVLLMRLVEQGEVGLDDPLTRWFPDAPQSWAGITVRQLANHSSGLAEQWGAARDVTVDGIVAKAMATPLAYAPGSEARYGFTDFTVLRAILEKAGGRPLPQLLREELLAPLGMTSTGFAMATDDGSVRVGEVLPHRASVYGLRDGRLATSDFFFAPQGYGAGGLYASIEDLARFFVAMDTGRVLRPESIRALETPGALAGGKQSSFGLGWIVGSYRGATTAGHSGGPALADIVRVEARQLTVIVLTNQQLLHPLLAEAILDTYLPAPPRMPGIADDRPMIASNIRTAMTSAVADHDPVAVFAPAGKDAAASLFSPFTRAMLRGVGPLGAVELIDVLANGQRRYRLDFAYKTMIWICAADTDARLTALRPD
ncbi:beta-lactamase family protein [Sphingomonas sp. R-74633]|uniref:serine hydrolase domain-containing protein n=1 Tax=Sphingomonas sp. R-74633 TaxID=2751188 RepID=UPI0015D1CA88|nr:serine hydrolase domain-containing protein [Sphingomonas sp. R-74633]NYT41970.1 beta-lactamase family protein [Sphingomonas sp. R-74633]